MRHIDKPLLLVRDRLPAHRSRLVREFIELSEGHIVTEYLPPYAPELNPVEYIWSYWKQHELPSVCPKDYGELNECARRALLMQRCRSGAGSVVGVGILTPRPSAVRAPDADGTPWRKQRGTQDALTLWPRVSTIAVMKTAGVREIKNRLSAYLRMVEHGERVAVTHRGRVVAEIGPPTHTTEEDAHAELRRRARAGSVRLGAPNRPDLYPRPSRRLPSRIVQDLLDEVRGER